MLKERDQRFGSAVELAEAIEALLGSTPISLSRSAEPQPPPLVGREPEFQKLEELLEKSIHGSGKFALLRGEPGIGKTALARSFLYTPPNATIPACWWAVARASNSMGPEKLICRSWRHCRDFWQVKSRERVVVLLRRHAPTWCLQFPSIFSGSALQQLEREAIGANKDRMLRELGDALEEIAAVFPVVFFLEDIQWGERYSIDLIRYLGQRAKTQRLLLLGTARPEEQQRGPRLLEKCTRELQTQSACEEIELQALGKGHITRYLNDHFSPNAFPPELADMIHRKTEGHPLFATGVFQLLAERSEVFNQDGTWHLARAVAEMDLTVPESVRSMIVKKLEVLEPEDRRALQYASIEGEEFLSTVLAALLEVDELALEERLDRLQRSHHLIQTRGEEELPDGSLAMRYRFAHALYQNFLYADLLSKRRALLHRQAGETLLRCYGRQTARIAMALATHFERGRDFTRAIEFLSQAGDNAVTIQAQAQALEHYGRGLELADKLSEEARLAVQMTLRKKRGDASLSLGRAADAEEDYNALLRVSRMAGHAEWECRALASLANVHHYTRKPEEMAICATDALEVAERIGHRALWSEATGQLAGSQLVIGRVAEARALFRTSIPAARPLGHLPALLQGLTYRGVVHFFQSEYELAVAAETEASQLAKESGNAFYLALSLTYLGFSLANRGRISEALSSLSEALALASRGGNQIVLSRAPNGVGYGYIVGIGNLRLAIEYNEACVETARRAQANEAESNALINLAYDYTQVGQPEKALAAIQRVDSLFDRENWMRWRFFDVRQQAAAAEYWLTARNLDRAEEHARRLLGNSRRYGVPKYIAIGHRLLGEIAAVSGDANAAEEEFIQSLQPFEKNPAPLVEWKNHAAFGRMLLDSGRRPAAARDAFSRAAVVVQQIYASIVEPELRSVFLDDPAVRQVIAESGSSASHA